MTPNALYAATLWPDAPLGWLCGALILAAAVLAVLAALAPRVERATRADEDEGQDKE